jgi:quinoprotein glucose dehydrogenase
MVSSRGQWREPDGGGVGMPHKKPPARSLAGKWLMLGAAVVVLGAIGGALYLWALLPQAHYAAEMRALTPLPADVEAQEWTHFAGGPGAAQFSPLDQITPENVGRLRVAWTYRTGEAERRGEDLRISSFNNTPILAGGSLIVCSPWARVSALDPTTGQERWTFDPELKLQQPAGHFYVCRGVAGWRDPNLPEQTPCAERVILATRDLRVIALDARNGVRCADFGQGGEVQVVAEEAYPGEVQFGGPPTIVGDVIIVGSSISDHVRQDSPSGAVRAFDVRTGEPRWEFDPIPRDSSDPAYATWLNDSALRTGGANVWADMSVDEGRGIVYLATSSPSLDHDGRERPGDNRYTNSVVALDGQTGSRLWDFQIVRHDLWDYDLASAPLLTTIAIDNRPRDAVIQVTKQGLVFVLDRETGEPLFPVEDRAVAQSDIPGELTAATQPFPTTMPWLMGLGLQGKEFSIADVWGVSFWDRARCRALVEQSRNLGLYGPPSKEGTILYPWVSGGSNLGMRAYDPQRRLLIVNLIRTVGVIAWPPQRLAEEAKVSRSGLLLSPFGVPCLAPPWGELVALDVEQQKVIWRVPLGTLEKLSGLPLRLRFGTPNRGGPLATGGGLIFIGATMDDAFRAFSADTGRELWRVQLPAGGQATPMTYVAGGRQYVVIAAGGHWMGTTPGDHVVAYALAD